MSSAPGILIVDDERSMRETLEIAFSDKPWSIATAASAEEAQRIVDRESIDVVLTDLRLPGVSGIDLLRLLRQADPDIQVILMTAFGEADTAVEAMKLGAYDYVQKPFNIEEVVVLIERALERRVLTAENQRLRTQLRQATAAPGLIATSAAMKEVERLVERVAPTDATVLITGESGSGKEVVARSIHRKSSRADGPFVAVNCGALPESLVEAELFGYQKGAFTGADQERAGLVEQADGGTLFLDEIGELPLQAQVKLLRVLQEQQVRRLGDLRERKLDVRFIAATNRELEAAVADGSFREDLFYRLNVFRIELPPLRERKDDLPELAAALLKRIAPRLGYEDASVSPAAMALLQAYDFPGNVRELENILERALILSPEGCIEPAALPADLSPRLPADTVVPAEIPADFDIEAFLENMERRLYQQAIAQAGGVRTRAAELLGLSFRQFRYKAKKLGV
ncbi:MAG: sigma-54-dependent Fis family transcriptional regulator [Candidatus Dadabacteria bacterium]|nr:MAG: sigma-54-dependent Fis family transcriptional regulator [Candidatus Dadabacteria bacterium]